MFVWSLPHDLTPEDRLTRTNWARRAAIFYGAGALLLLGIMVAQDILVAEPDGRAGLAAPASPIGKGPTAAERDPGASAASIRADAERTPAPSPSSAIDLRAIISDPAVRDFVGLAENAFDFSKPDGVPGFGPLRPSDDIDQLRAQATGNPAGPHRVAQPLPGVAANAP